jgi:hypothetical protein
LTKIHFNDSHFLALHNGNVICAHALILRSYWRGKTPLLVLNAHYGIPAQVFVILLCSFLSVLSTYFEGNDG